MSTNINNTVPAAPAGSTNVNWQTDGSGNMSAYVTNYANEITVSNVDLLNQTANIASTTLFTPAAGGLYRISAYLIVTTVDGTSSTLPALTIGWTDPDNSTAQTLVLTPTNAGNTFTTHQTATCLINAKISVIVTFSTGSYASDTPATMAYSLHIRIEAL
jgi:hypothetical protein